jgi:xylose isomerase
MRHAVLTAFFGKLRDRFCDYQHPLSMTEKLQRASEVSGVDGVEVIFPDEVREAAQIASDLDRHGLEVSAVNVNLKGDRAFQHGALSSPDPGVRGRAIDLLREAKTVARDLGVRRITCAPLADGYDSVFQVDYRRVWQRMVESIACAASDQPDVVLHLEHKPAEPRSVGLLDTPAKVIRLCRDVGLDSVGITFNAGHALAGGHLPAAAFADVLHARLPYYIHFCDATASWDWDLRAGSRHVWAWAELLFYLRQDGYDGWLTADTFPVRQDPHTVFTANVAVTDALCRWLDGLDAEVVAEGCRQQRVRPMLAELERCLPARA